MDKTDPFDKRQSQIVKGAAILLMLWHHCFLSGRFDGFTISFFPLTEGQATLFAAFCKICVSLFAFVSGYGLYYSYRKWDLSHPGKSCSRWLWVRYVRTFSGYWVIVVLSWIIGGLIDGRPVAVYSTPSRVAGCVYMALDFFGLGQLFGIKLFVNEWWYMSAVMVFILSTPLLYGFMEKHGPVSCLLTVYIVPLLITGYPGGMSPLTFLPVFCLGMIVSRIDLFRILSSQFQSSGYSFVFALVSVALTAACFIIDKRLPTKQFWLFKYGLFPIVYILCIYYVLAKIPILSSVLAFLGKHSANIYFTHTVLLYLYCRSFIFGRGHFLLIMATLLGLSLLVSFALEGLKKLIRYDRFCAKLEALSFSPAKQ